MDDSEIERVAARIVDKLSRPENLQALARAIAEELRLRMLEQDAELARLGERLDSGHY